VWRWTLGTAAVWNIWCWKGWFWSDGSSLVQIELTSWSSNRSSKRIRRRVALIAIVVGGDIAGHEDVEDESALVVGRDAAAAGRPYTNEHAPRQTSLVDRPAREARPAGEPRQQRDRERESRTARNGAMRCHKQLPPPGARSRHAGVRAATTQVAGVVAGERDVKMKRGHRLSCRWDEWQRNAIMMAIIRRPWTMQAYVCTVQTPAGTWPNKLQSSANSRFYSNVVVN